MNSERHPTSVIRHLLPWTFITGYQLIVLAIASLSNLAIYFYSEPPNRSAVISPNFEEHVLHSRMTLHRPQSLRFFFSGSEACQRTLGNVDQLHSHYTGQAPLNPPLLFPRSFAHPVNGTILISMLRSRLYDPDGPRWDDLPSKQVQNGRRQQCFPRHVRDMR